METNAHREKNISAGGRRLRYILSFAVLAGLLLVFLVWNICAGSVSISPDEIIKSLLGRDIGETAANILWLSLIHILKGQSSAKYIEICIIRGRI